jgi:peptidoglycan hydrolase CwlO-like protein
MRRLAGGAVALALVVASVLGSAAHAQQDFVESDPEVIRAREQLVSAQLAAHQAAGELEATARQRDDTQISIDQHVARIEELGRQRETLAAYRDALHAVMRDRAVALYRNGGDGTGIAAIEESGSALEAARRQQLGSAAAESNQRTARQLEEARAQLAGVQGTLREEEAELRRRRAELDVLVAQQEERQAVVDERVAAANVALERARAVGALRAAGDPVMGPATLTADQLAGWVRAQGFSPRIETDLTELAQIFIDEGNDEGVRGDFAFAQSVIETGGFESAPANNYSGIGWCDTCAVGNRFPDPREGVRAQIQLLVNYADAGATAAGLTHPVLPYLYGSDLVAAARRFDNFFAKGWAPTWREMGNGNWATDPGYSAKVIGVYRRMATYAQGG